MKYNYYKENHRNPHDIQVLQAIKVPLNSTKSHQTPMFPVLFRHPLPPVCDEVFPVIVVLTPDGDFMIRVFLVQ